MNANIETLSANAAAAKTSPEAMQYAQAALNLAHVAATLASIPAAPDHEAESQARDQNAFRYIARRKAIYLARTRCQVGGPRQTESEFNEEFDAGSDRNINGYTVDNRGVWVKDEDMRIGAEL